MTLPRLSGSETWWCSDGDGFPSREAAQEHCDYLNEITNSTGYRVEERMHRVYRENPHRAGWAIATPAGDTLLVDGCPARGLTRWEARQTCGMLGLTYTEDTA